MRDYNDETAFLVQLLSYDESRKSREVQEKIFRVQREQSCVFKAVWTVGLITALLALLSQEEYFQSGPAIGLRIICVLGIAGLICLLAFALVLMIYCIKLNGLRNEGRHIIGEVATKRLAHTADILVFPNGPIEQPGQLALDV